MTYLLYVDDEPDLLELTRLFLERSGEFVVVTCASAREALESPCFPRCDAIVSDYQMPEMDGIEFLKAVRERRMEVPFILFTGRGREEVVIEAINNGADFYLQKGGDPRAQFAELVHKVRQALSKRRTEAALTETEKRLGDIIDFLPDATFAIDREGRVIAWNRSVEELTGVRADEIIGKGRYAYAEPFYGERRPILIDLVLDPAAVLDEGYEQVVRRDGVLVADTALPRPRGRPMILRGMASPLYDREGAVVGAIESVRDISDLKRVEADLRTSEEKYRLAAELSGLVVYDSDLSTGKGAIAGAIREVIGLEPGEESVLDTFGAWMDRVHPDDLPAVLAALGDANAPARSYSVEYRFQGRDGTWIPIEDTGGVLLDTTGRPARRIGTLRDLSKRKEQEEALRRSEEKYRGLVERISDFVLLLDHDLSLTYASPSFVALSGLDLDHRRGSLLPLDALEESGRMAVLDAYERLQALEPVGPVEVSLRIRDRDPIVIEFNGTPIHHDGVFLGAQIVGHDITALRTAQERLQAAHDALLAAEADLRRQVDALTWSEQQASENEARFRAIFEHSPYAISITGPTGAYLAVNPAFERDSGYSSAEAIGRTPVEIGLMPAEVYFRIGTELFQKGRVEQVPFTTRRSDGEEGYALISAIRIVYDNRPSVMAIVIDITEKTRAERTIREKNEEIDQFFSTSLDLFCIADLDGHFRRLNREWETTLGYTTEELQGRRFLDFVHPDDLEGTLEAMATLQEQRPVLNFTNRYRHRDGSYRWIEWRSMPVGGLIYASARDITDRHEAAARASRISTLKQELIHSAPLEERLKAITDAVVELIGAEFARIWLVGHGDLCDAGCVHATAPQGAHDCPDRTACLHLVASSGRYWQTDGSHRRVPFGRYKIGQIASGDIPGFLTNDVQHDPRVHDHEWAASLGLVSFAGFRLVDTEGAPIGVLAVFSRHPISDMDSASLQDLATTASQVVRTGTIERALRQSEQQYRSIIENVEDGYLRSDRKDLVVLANPSAAEMFGYASSDDLRGLPAESLYRSTEERAALLQRVQEIDHVRDFEIEMARRDGSSFWASVNAHLLFDDEGSCVGMEGFVRDITERRRMETAVREANRKLNLLNSITRHDVVNQLTVLEGYVNLAADNPSSPKAVAYLENVRSTARTIARQLEFTKTYQELGVDAPAWVRIAGLVEGTAPLPLEIRGACGGWEIFADPMVRLVSANLLDNAVRHGEGVTRVVVGCEEGTAGLVITVQDDGVGIPHEDKERIFQKGVGKNTGLGLFLVREILGITGIAIRETGEPGAGARFEIVVPAGSYRKKPSPTPP